MEKSKKEDSRGEIKKRKMMWKKKRGKCRKEMKMRKKKKGKTD